LLRPDLKTNLVRLDDQTEQVKMDWADREIEDLAGGPSDLQWRGDPLLRERGRLAGGGVRRRSDDAHDGVTVRG
jgi:hypothetical protein